MVLPATAPEPDDHPNVARLWDDLRRHQRRYGETSEVSVGRLEDRAQGHRVRLERIEEHLAELEVERRRLTQELAGWEKAIALTLGTEIERLRLRNAEAWSPTPVMGYRVWGIRRDGLHGARARWRDPWLVARCADGGDPDEVPHSDRRCGRLGCGIYAVKDPITLVREWQGDGVLGMVALTGKVVEHERGYRGREARVVALGMVLQGRTLVTDDPAVVAAVFHDPAQAAVRWGVREPWPDWRPLVDQLMARARAAR